LLELEALRQRYQAERPAYEELAKCVAEMLTRAAEGRRLECNISYRAKEVGSLVKKVLRKNYGWDDIKDKAGVRVVTVYQDTIPRVEEIIADLFAVEGREDKLQTLEEEPYKLDYLGVHIEVSVPAEHLPAGRAELSTLICEIQLHTRAQNLWATVSHELIYKTAEQPPSAVQRSIYRLMALLELFDAEVERGRESIMSQPGFPVGRMVKGLEDCFYGLTARKSDGLLSRRIVTLLRPLYTQAELEDFDSHLETFVNANRSKLEGIFADYLDDDRNPLMSQPESLLIFDRLNTNYFELVDVWAQQQLPPSLLRSLSEIWGKPVDPYGED
jgi:ppGpp synthetase/RelA/SpoT-type nucleotidyltranferase